MRRPRRGPLSSIMGDARYIACALLLLCPLALSRHDDDFAFDNSEEFQVELTANHSEIAKNGLRRLWGVPDTSAYVGYLFRTEIPKEAFTGEVLAYKVRSEDGHRTPSWLAVDSKHGLISGIPQQQDVGAHTFTVTAHGRTHGLSATDSFTIEVKKAEDKPQSKYGSCAGNQARLVLVILIDGAMHRIPPRQRIRALMELANFMALDGDEFWMEPYKQEASSAAVLMSGPGTTQRRRGDAITAISFNTGCGDKLWTRHKVLVNGLREQARDGTVSHLLRLNVIGWRLTAVKPLPRSKRQSSLDSGSGGYSYGDDADYSGDDYDTEDADDDYAANGDDDMPDLVDPPSPATAPPPTHPHRHHHGDPQTTTDDFQTETTITTVTTQKPTLPPPTAPVTTVPPTPSPTVLDTSPVSTTEEITTLEDTTTELTTNTFTTEEDKVKITSYAEATPDASNVNITRVPSSRAFGGHSPIIIVPDDMPTSTEPEMQTVIIRASNEIPSSSELPVTSPSPSTEPSPSPQSTTPRPTTPRPTTARSTSARPTTARSTTPEMIIPVTSSTQTTPTATPTTTPQAETTIEEITEQEIMTSTERTSTIFGRTTETITFALPANQPPTLNHHMKKLALIAGKAFRYIIPADLFTDAEDGSNLTFSMYEAGSQKLDKDSWIQFIPTAREVYGLPLVAQVSRWNFIVEAHDSEGQIARGPLDITVQHHRAGRTFNHQFVMTLKPNLPYNNTVDWQIRALEGIVNLFRDTDMEHLTVLNATQVGDLYEFVWTNDTLPKDPACPMGDIKRLMQILESDTEPGSPSAQLVRAMSPELKVSAVAWRGRGPCERPAASTRAPDVFPPVSRNQIDLVRATVGQLLLYKVPEDTFFDPEDGDTRHLSLSLRYSDRSELPAGHWLQFDQKNQEFYGLPAPGDEGAVSYQLIAQDQSKKNAYDSLVVEVCRAPSIRPTVEFQMTMEYPFPELAYKANNKRKVVEKLAALFGQTDTDNIRIHSITDNPTTIIWYNTSLPMDRCPKKEIEELRKMIIIDERGSTGGALKENVDHVFDKDLKVMSIRLIPLGLCAEQQTKVPKTTVPVLTGTNLQNTKAGSEHIQYLVTFVIPAVVIVCMIVVAGIIACVLYRRRRTGKMSVGDEEERQAFRSKGIPVIFQDELEERGDSEPVHKSPVIMREEKPPLLPPAPDYRSSDDAPYRPPPPFAASRTPPRPKATPTYRKPPPYVPP